MKRTVICLTLLLYIVVACGLPVQAAPTSVMIVKTNILPHIIIHISDINFGDIIVGTNEHENSTFSHMVYTNCSVSITVESLGFNAFELNDHIQYSMELGLHSTTKFYAGTKAPNPIIIDNHGAYSFIWNTYFDSDSFSDSNWWEIESAQYFDQVTITISLIDE